MTVLIPSGREGGEKKGGRRDRIFPYRGIESIFSIFLLTHPLSYLIGIGIREMIEDRKEKKGGRDNFNYDYINRYNRYNINERVKN